MEVNVRRDGEYYIVELPIAQEEPKVEQVSEASKPVGETPKTETDQVDETVTVQQVQEPPKIEEPVIEQVSEPQPDKPLINKLPIHKEKKNRTEKLIKPQKQNLSNRNFILFDLKHVPWKLDC
jgi:hypothetical protein